MNELAIVGFAVYIAAWGYIGYRIGRWATRRRRVKDAAILWSFETSVK